MKRFLLLFILAIAGVLPLSAQTAAFNGVCFTGGRSAVTQGLNSSNKLDGIIPSCQVTVYLTGTTTLAPAIYRDAINTPLSNPFTADNLSAAAPGKWLFFAPIGQGYDVVMSGGIPPLTYLLPVTLTDLQIGGGGGGSGVTSFSAGNLPPLFTTSVSNPGTTPNLSFILTNAPAVNLFGNPTNSTGSPFYFSYTCTGLLTCTYSSGSNTLNLNVASSASLSITATSPITVNGGTGPVASGTANIACPTCGAVNATTFITIPTGNYVLIYPHRFTITRRDFAPGSIVGSADGQNGSGYISMGNTCSLSYTNIGTWDQFDLADVGLTSGQVLDVTAVAISSISSTDANTFCFPTLADPNWASTSLISGSANMSLPANQPSAAQQTSGATGFTGAQVATATTVATMTVTGATRLFTNYNINSVALQIHYSGATIAAPNRLYVRPPLGYDLTTQSIFLDPNFPQQLNSYPLGHEPGANNGYGTGIIITGTTDCVNASGNVNDEVLCKPHNVAGSVFVWAPMFTGGGSSSTYFTETLTCTSTCTLSHTPVEFDNLSVNGLVMINGTDFTQSGTTITLTTPAAGGDVYYAQYRY